MEEYWSEGRGSAGFAVVAAVVVSTVVASVAAGVVDSAHAVATGSREEIAKREASSFFFMFYLFRNSWVCGLCIVILLYNLSKIFNREYTFAILHLNKTVILNSTTARISLKCRTFIDFYSKKL